MAGERIIENSEQMVQGLKPDSAAVKPEKDMGSFKQKWISSDTASPLPTLGDVTTGLKGDNQNLDAEQGVYYPPTSCYNYYYPGYNGTFNQLDDQGYLAMGGGYSGIPSDNSSLLYYLPGYNPYNTGFIGADGEQLPYVSSGYFQQPVSYGSEALPPHTWDSMYVGDVKNRVVSKTDDVKAAFGQNESVNSSVINSSKINSSSTVPLNSKARKFTLPSDFCKSFPHTRPLKPLNKLGPGFPSIENMNGVYPAGKLSAFSNQNRGLYMHYGPMNYQPNGRVWNTYQRSRSRSNFRREGENEASNELSRGPRANGKSEHSKLSADDEQAELTVQRDKYNLEDFQCEYDNGKFYVIKSYSEDDIHKCIKYDVWSSTPNGNKKLDAAFRDAEFKATEKGTKCPIFLFFSVNGSGQFLGVAEMVGQVDFNKNMDFWQLDKWNGFFPVKWHIVKDVPNSLLRHIILENNDNRAVTYSRDTQEIGLKQGLEMLSIFKSYSAKTSLLDDFKFYGGREKSLKAHRSTKPTLQTDVLKEDDSPKPLKEGCKTNGTDLMPSLVNLTKDLSLNPPLPLKSTV
nr:LOW QUALITY PROTEIN: YTH domain-containing protein ECT4 [Coffea arabica]